MSSSPFITFINEIYYIYYFSYVEPLLHLWNEANLITVNDFFMLSCIYFTVGFFFVPVFTRDSGL